MADHAESSRRAPPMTPPPPPPPSPAIPEDSGSEAILWAAPDDCSSSSPHNDLLSLWLSNYTALPDPEAEEEPLAAVPTVQNFDLESSFPDLVDWNTNSTAVVTQAPVVSQQSWAQLEDLSQVALGIQSPEVSILPLTLGIQSPNSFTELSPPALGIQFPEASISPLALGIHPSPASFATQSPEDPSSSLALGIHPPPASAGKEAPKASLSPLALGLQSPRASLGTQSLHSFARATPPQAAISPLAHGIRFPEASISPSISPPALGNQSPQISIRIQSAPLPFPSLPSIPCTLPTAPPLWNALPSPSPVPERRTWSVFSSTPPPACPQQLLLLPHSTTAGLGSPPTHPSHQPRHFFPAPLAAYQPPVPVADLAPVTFSTPNARANFFAGYVPASRPPWSQAMAPRRSWTPNQPWTNNGQDMKLPIPRRPPLALRPATAAVATTMPAQPPLLANVGSSVGNTPSWIARGDTPARDHERVQTGESSTPSRKRSKAAARTR